MIIRLIGLALMVIAVGGFHILCGLVHAAAPHQPNAVELSLALGIVVTGLGGVLMAAAGSELIRSSSDH